MSFVKALVGGFLLMSAVSFSFADEFKVVLADYKPYSWEESSVAVGLEIDILKAAVQNRMGVPLSIKILPWARAQNNVKSGLDDAFIAVATEKRRAYTVVSDESIAYWGVSVFTKYSGSRVWDLASVKTVADLEPFSLGSMIGNGWAEKNLDGMSVIWTRDMRQLLKMVVAGRVEVLPDSPAVVKYHLKEMQLEGALVEVSSLMSLPMHLCVGAKSSYAGILPEFDKTIRAMKADGSLQKIISHYE